MKKTILLIIISSLIFSIFSDYILIKEEFIFNTILTILGVSFAAYSFLYTPLYNIMCMDDFHSEKLFRSLERLLKGLAENIRFLFILLILVLLLNVIYLTDLPFLKDICNINLYMIQISSFKGLLYEFVNFNVLFLGFYAFFDIIEATFTIFNNCFSIKKIKNRKNLVTKKDQIH